jgi:NAD(P)-dependent dehydrogenase (short-subunit alcohol dehydrogenase family)
VNAIAPGITLTRRILARPGAVDAERFLVKKHLLGLVEPIDIAQLAVYLASDESRRVTGQVLQVDSGATLE